MDNIHPDKPGIGQAEVDFGWIIQNRQMGETEFCQFLVHEISPEIERLVQRFVKSPAERMKWVDEILFTALLQRHEFKNNLSGKTWLYRIALQVCTNHAGTGILNRGIQVDRIMRTIDLRLPENAHFQAYFETLSKQERLYAILHKGQGLSEDDTAAILHRKPGQVHEGLEHIRQSLLVHQQTCPHCINLPMTVSAMESALEQDLQTDSPLLDAAREDHTEWSHALLDRLHRSTTRRQAQKWVNRVAKFGLVACLFLAAQWAYSGRVLFFDLSPSSTPVVSEPAGMKEVVLATQLTPAPSSTPMKVTQSQDAQPIINLALTSWSRWQTLWADVSIHTYAQEQFSEGTGLTPKESMRKQIWLSLPGSSRVIIGPDTLAPTLSYSISNHHMTGQNFASSQIIDQEETTIIPDTDLQGLFLPTAMFNSGGQFKTVGEETIAGRAAWIIDWDSNGHRAYRYWIDKQYGIILRRQQFGEGIYQPVISEITVTNIYFNATLPDAVFQPNLYKGDHFAYDFSGNPEIANIKLALKTWTPAAASVPATTQTPAPSDNYASARLSFHEEPAGWMQRPQGAGIEIFAGHQDLGQLPLGGSTVLSCTRSPDGSKIAYNSPPQAGTTDTALYVGDLSSIQSAKPALEGGITAGDFAFSPDNRWLAFFGCEKSTGFCGSFLLDLTNWKLTRLAPLTYAEYLTWSPDSRSIAMLGKGDLSLALPKLSTANLLESEMIPLLHAWSYLVIDANNGNITHKQLFDWSSLDGMFNPASKTVQLPLKTHTYGVQGCVNPPASSEGH